MRCISVVVITGALVFSCAAAGQPQVSQPQVGQAQDGQAVVRQEADDSARRFRVLRRDYIRRNWDSHPVKAATAGLHQYDGMSPDFSMEGIEAWLTYNKQVLLRLREIDPNRLAAEDQLDRDILIYACGNVLFELEDLHGEVDGIAFDVHGRMDGFEADAPFSISVTTDPFDVPAEGGLWDKMPPRVRKYQERFSPQGTYQAQVTIERTTRGADPLFRGYLDLLDTRFAYYKFPYPAEKLTGRVTFDNQRIVLHDLIGIGPSGGRGVVSGTITPPGGDAEVD